VLFPWEFPSPTFPFLVKQNDWCYILGSSNKIGNHIRHILIINYMPLRKDNLKIILFQLVKQDTPFGIWTTKHLLRRSPLQHIPLIGMIRTHWRGSTERITSVTIIVNVELKWFLNFEFERGNIKRPYSGQTANSLRLEQTTVVGH
jgi:hypothetical protein